MNEIICFNLPPGAPRRMALGIGVFDGVHLGHRRIIGELARQAERTGALPVAVTFEPHPRTVLGAPPTPLLPFAERCRLLLEAGARGIGVIRFNSAVAALEPEEFFNRVTASVELAGICVGEHWRFGRHGGGDKAVLAALAGRHGFEFRPCPELSVNGEIVSASAIRRLTSEGRLDEAAAMLGRPCRLFGRVGHGNQVAAARLAAPTANLAISAGVPPPDGVYAGRAEADGETYAAAINIGWSPTFNGRVRRVEVHLLDFAGDLYGRDMAVELLRFIRPERNFGSAERLREQIALDIKSIREAAL